MLTSFDGIEKMVDVIDKVVRGLVKSFFIEI